MPRAENLWAFRSKSGDMILVPVEKGPDGKKLPRPEGYLDAQVFHPLSKSAGRRKGSGLEIVVAKILNQFFYDGLEVLRRTPLSGGWGQGLGDICASPEAIRKYKVALPPVYVECKRGQGISHTSLLNWAFYGKPTMFTGWLKEAVKQADGRTVLLVVQGDGQDPWVIRKGALMTEMDNTNKGILVQKHQVALLPLKDLARKGPVAKERDGDAGDIESG